MGYITIKYIIRLSLLAGLIYLRQLAEVNEKLLNNTFSIIHSVLTFFIFLTIINIVTSILVMVYRLRKNIPYKFTDNVINGINNLYYLIVTFGVILMILGFWDIEIKDLLTSLSIVAAALAIISKEYVNSIISGIIISFSKEINIDDYVKISGHKGKIIDITLTKISLLNDDDDIIYIPNDKVYQSEVINYTKKELKKVSVDFELDAKYHTTIEMLEAKLIDALKDYKEYIEDDSFNIKIVNLYHDYLSLKFQYKLKEVNREAERMIRRKTIRVIANSIKENEIEKSKNS
ncbi:MAG: mechanosensitive ion channel [Saprospiraceae bacterium]|nr:mechanosensitive ion channel [Saprospiraceae bacterium]